MPYIVRRLLPAPAQVSIYDILDNVGDTEVRARHITNGATLTRFVENVKQEILDEVNVDALIYRLEEFIKNHDSLFKAERKSLYYEFSIPKKTGGLRKIDAPNDDLKAALVELKLILENDFGALYHTSAYAYVRGRCTVDAVKRHQANNSKWVLKTDFSNFFGSTTLDFTMKMISMLFPFSEVVKIQRGKDALEKALSLGFLDGGLPQGTPLSPTLTNIVMIPIDHALAKHFSEKNMVYTRYADDIDVSCQVGFKFTDEVAFINKTVRDFGAPFMIKPEKTHYGSTAGRNWILGVMLNKDNAITIGHARKKQFKAMIHNYLTDYKKGVRWDVGDVQQLQGLISYYLMIERQYITHVIIENNKKHGLNLGQVMKADLGSRHAAV